MNRTDVAIVGTGHGGAQAAIALRQQGFEGSITLIGRETDPPYERPPLSKDYLAGEKEFDRLLIRPPTFWAERDIDLRLGISVDHIDAAVRSLGLSIGEQLQFGRLIWAAGGEARRLSCSGHDLPNVHSVRTHADVAALRAELAGIRTVAIIGGGYIGLEAAAVLRKLGKQVILLEAFDRVLSRVAGPELSAFYEAEHRAHGVEIRTRITVECIEEGDGMAVGVRLADGEVIAADTVVVGIGIIPAVAPLTAAGAATDNGVLVDECCRTSLPDIYAIGDCAAHANAFAGGAIVRLESVQNATDQAIVAAKAILGRAEPYAAVPWFWSNQYDLKLQTVGLSHGHDARVLRGDPANRSFSLVYLKQGSVVALDCVNAVKDFVQGRKLVEGHIHVAPATLADAKVALKDLIA